MGVLEMSSGTFDDEIAVAEEPIIEVRDILNEMVTLTREGYHEMGTFGTLRYKDFDCKTVERPWSNNTVFISCIPPGIYPIKLGKFYQGGYPCWELDQVPNRSLIKIHRANTMNDLKGCIGLGSTFGTVDKTWAVLNSRQTHDEFMRAMREHGADKADRMYINIKNIEVGVWSAPGYATTE